MKILTLIKIQISQLVGRERQIMVRLKRVQRQKGKKRPQFSRCILCNFYFMFNFSGCSVWFFDAPKNMSYPLISFLSVVLKWTCARYIKCKTATSKSGAELILSIPGWNGSDSSSVHPRKSMTSVVFEHFLIVKRNEALLLYSTHKALNF